MIPDTSFIFLMITFISAFLEEKKLLLLDPTVNSVSVFLLQDAYFLFASTEWTFHSGRNEMVHSIPAGMKQFIPAGMEWAIPFRPE